MKIGSYSCACKLSDLLATVRALYGLSKERSKELKKQIKAHMKTCRDGESGFHGGEFLSTCPIDCQTPQEVAFVAVLLDTCYQNLHNPLAGLFSQLLD